MELNTFNMIYNYILYMYYKIIHYYMYVKKDRGRREEGERENE